MSGREGDSVTAKPVSVRDDTPGTLVAPGTKVRVVDVGNLPSIRTYAGREGITERPEEDGCYVRFADGSYVFLFWGEMEAAS